MSIQCIIFAINYSKVKEIIKYKECKLITQIKNLIYLNKVNKKLIKQKFADQHIFFMNFICFTTMIEP